MRAPPSLAPVRVWGRRGLVLATVAFLVLVLRVVGGSTPVAQAVAGTDTVTFTTAGEHVFVLPAGVDRLRVVAIGQAGAAGQTAGGAGGLGAEVAGGLKVEPLSSYYAVVDVGSGGSGVAWSKWGGAGGGASDLRTCSASAESCHGGGTSLDSRLLVAAGGGGGGSGSAFGPGGAGGNAGSSGLDGQNGNGENGAGGGVGTLAAGGAGGAGFQEGGPGAAGAFGLGGIGGTAHVVTGISGGGGGGGYYGGGGGGGADGPTYASGGGGGGSSYYAETIEDPAVNVPASSSSASVAVSFTDTTAPIVSLDPVAGRGTDTTPTFSGSGGTVFGDASMVTVKIYVGSAASGSPVQTHEASIDPGTGAYTVDASPALADGTYTAQAEQQDGTQPRSNVGRSAARSFTIDTTAPTPTLTNPADGAQTNDTTPTFSGVGGTATGDATTVTINLWAGASMSNTPLQTHSTGVDPSTSAYTIDASPALAEGAYTIQVTQLDDLGHAGTSAAATFTVDTTAPNVTLTGPTAFTNNATPVLSGHAGTAAADWSTVTVRVYAGASATGTAIRTHAGTVDAAGTYTTTVSPALSDGVYTAQTGHGDRAGNSALSTPVSFTIDTRAPDTSILAGPSTWTTTRTPTFTFASSEASSTFACSLDHQPLATCRSPFTTPRLSDGRHLLRVAAIDRAGNVDPAPDSRTFTTGPPPVIQRLSLSARCLRRVQGRARQSLTITARVSIRSRLTITIEQAVAVKSRPRCPRTVTPPRRQPRYKQVKKINTSANRVVLRPALKPGLYRITTQALTTDGRSSRLTQRYIAVLTR